MPDRWFRLPATGSGTGSDPNRPAYVDTSGIDGYAGSHIDETPRWVARVYGTNAALDELAGRQNVTELSTSEAVAAFERARVPHLPRHGWSTNTINEHFWIRRGTQ